MVSLNYSVADKQPVLNTCAVSNRAPCTSTMSGRISDDRLHPYVSVIDISLAKKSGEPVSHKYRRRT